MTNMRGGQEQITEILDQRVLQPIAADITLPGATEDETVQRPA